MGRNKFAQSVRDRSTCVQWKIGVKWTPLSILSGKQSITQTYHSFVQVRIRSHLWRQCETWLCFYQTRSAWSVDQGTNKNHSPACNFTPTVTKFCVMWEGLSLPHDTKFGNCRCKIVDSRAFPSWSLIHGLRWSGLIKAEPGCDFWFQLENGYANHKSLPKRPLSFPQHQENPKIPEPGSHVHDYICIYYKPDWLLQQFDEWTTRESHQETPACAKHSCQTSFQSEEIWLPVKYRIEFKTLLIVFKGLYDKAPTYIKEMITPSKSKR